MGCLGPEEEGSRGSSSCFQTADRLLVAFREDLTFPSAWELACGLLQLTAPAPAGRHCLDHVRLEGPPRKVALNEALSGDDCVIAVHLGPPRNVSCPLVVCPSPLLSVPFILPTRWLRTSS